MARHFQPLPARQKRFVAVVALIGAVATGCSTVSSRSTPAPTATQAPTASVPAAELPTPQSTGPNVLPVVGGGNSTVISPGTYVTHPQRGFFPGLELTVPDGWLAEETDSGELKLRRSQTDNVLLMWKDLLPVETNNRAGNVGKAMLDADTTADGIVEWLTTLSDVEILDGPSDVTFGDGIEGVELTLTTSDTADFAEPDCPANPECVALFTDIHHWPPREFYGIGGDESARLLIATAPYPDGDHTFYVALDAPNATELEDLRAEAQPIIDSIRLPETYTDN